MALSECGYLPEWTRSCVHHLDKVVQLRGALPCESSYLYLPLVLEQSEKHVGKKKEAL